MTIQPDVRIQEFGNLRLSLRNDLVFSPSLSAEQDGYTIEDPVTDKFYRIGLKEYEFLSQLNGRATIGEVLQQAATNSPARALNQREAALLCHWLIQTQLALPTQSQQSQAPTANDASKNGQWNPARLLFFKLPLFDLDRVLSSLHAYVGWMFGRNAIIAWFVVVASGIYQVAMRTDRLQQGAAGILASSNWLWLGLSWCALKIIHELAHGLVCKRYGGYVREGGLLFILLTPVAYVDITSSWRFRSKWQRIHAALAGMYAEFFVAALAAWVWSQTEAGLAQHIAFNTMIMASITTLAFNANPLMRFDGYYVLADWLEIHNLSFHASNFWRKLAQRFFLGLPHISPKLSPRREALLRVYGAAVIGWWCLVTTSMILALSVMFRGAGIILSVIGVSLWLVGPLWRFITSLSNPQGPRPNWIRFFITGGSSVATLVLLFTVVPWIGPYRAPAVVEYSPLSVVRAGSPGFVAELHVQHGQRVSAGDILVVLSNPEISAELRDLELNIELTELKSRKLQLENKLAEYQAEQEQLVSYHLQLDEKSAQVENLVVRAPMNGVVMGRPLNTMLGTYLELGDEILAIGDGHRKELRMSIAQHDAQMFASRVGQRLRVRLDDGQVLPGTLSDLEPQASTIPPHTALGANCGGPLPVTERRVQDDGEERVNYEFPAPRLVALMPLDPVASERLFSGQLGQVSFRSSSESFAGHVLSVGHRWLTSKLEVLLRSQE